MAAAAAMMASTLDDSARNSRFLIVGVIICSSPEAWRSSASAGRTQRLAMVSLSSCSGSWASGARATKNRVSKRRGSPTGVIQWLT